MRAVRFSRRRSAPAFRLPRAAAAAVLATTLALSAGFFAVIFGGGNSAWAMLRSLSLEDMARKSEIILCGEVVDMKCYRGAFLDLGEIIFTDVTIKITERIAGKAEGDTITIQVPGGRIGEQFMTCPDAPVYEKGEKALLFLRTYNGRIWNTGWAQGKYRLKPPADPSSGDVKVEGKQEFAIRQVRDLGAVRQDLLGILRAEGKK